MRHGEEDVAKRLFIALPLPETAKSEISAFVHALRRTAPEIRWVRPEQMHVTMKFLGDVELEREKMLMGVLEPLSTMRPFQFNLAGLGAFPDRRRARVVWTGIDLGKAEVTELAGLVETACEAAGFEREERGFSAHITLARVKEPGDFGPLWRQADEIRFVGHPVHATEVRLIHSTLTPKGPVYRDLESFPLRGPNSQS